MNDVVELSATSEPIWFCEMRPDLLLTARFAGEIGRVEGRCTVCDLVESKCRWKLTIETKDQDR